MFTPVLVKHTALVVASDLEFVGERLEVDVTEFTESLESRAAEIENERAGTEGDVNDDDDDRWNSDSRGSDEDAESMFESLREELED